MNTLDGLEDAGRSCGIKETSARAFVASLNDSHALSPYASDLADSLIALARNIDYYLDSRKNTASVFDVYNQTLEKLHELYPDAAIVQEEDESLASLLREALR